MTTLDRARPYAQIFPEHNGAAFEQDGVLYDAHGNRVGGNPVPANFAKRPPGRPRKDETPDAPAAENPQLAAQLEDA